MQPRGVPASSGLCDGSPYYGQLVLVAYDGDEDKVQCHLLRSMVPRGRRLALGVRSSFRCF
jgi:hypothetical protein